MGFNSGFKGLKPTPECPSAKIKFHQQDRKCTYTRKIEWRSRNHCCRGKVIIITYLCVSAALVIQHAMRIGCIILSFVAYAALLHFFHTMSQTARFSGGGEGGKSRNIKRVFWFSPQRSSEIFLIHRRNERDMNKNVYWSSCKVPVIYVVLYWHWNFLGIFSKNTQTTNSTKIRPVEANFFSCGRTNMTKLIVSFRNFANAPKIDSLFWNTISKIRLVLATFRLLWGLLYIALFECSYTHTHTHTKHTDV